MIGWKLYLLTPNVDLNFLEVTYHNHCNESRLANYGILGVKLWLSGISLCIVQKNLLKTEKNSFTNFSLFKHGQKKVVN